MPNMNISTVKTMGRFNRVVLRGVEHRCNCQLKSINTHQKRFLSEAEGAAAGEGATAGTAASRLSFGHIVGGSVIIFGLYATRLHNPIYTSIIGETETNLGLAESHAGLPFQYYYDSRSASDSLIPRLKAMEKHLGVAMTASQKDNSKDIYERVNDIRSKGYSNAAKVSLSRAEHYAETGELKKFEEILEQTNKFISEGGTVDAKELDRVKSVAYGTKSNQLMAQAQTMANKGDVSGCANAVSQINNIRAMYDKIEISENDTKDVITRAHSHHITHLLNEAKNLKQQGSRRQAKVAIERAKNYANLNNVSFPENAEKDILG